MCLQDAAGRLDNVFSSSNDTYTKVVLEILCSPIPVRTNTPLSQRHDVEGNVIHIAWGLIEVTSAKDTLHINSMEHTLDIIKAAVTYETEYGLVGVKSHSYLHSHLRCSLLIQLYDHSLKLCH